ncbi:MAG: twin-arginine translocation signal domain-containing protein [Betaproteobacteria bacterium]|nr:twin-arginine translocation signal domain-containing protein [Betaproteobacteria bacterium]
MEDNGKKMSRRSILKGAAALAGLSVVPGLIASRTAEAAKVPKAAMQYRDHPNGANHCSKCIQFIPGGSPAANGTCKVVAGSISPNGWCVAFSPKA